MDNLKENLEAIREKIKKHHDLYSSSEESVRYQIVNPILRSLGWDPENPELVLPNISTEEGIPDYTLIKNGKNVLFIEAKKLSVDLEDKGVIKQLAKYCFGEGMKYGLLTNGALWTLFLAFQESTTMAERTIWKIDLENDELVAIIRRFNIISRDNIEKVEELTKKLQILDEIWQSSLDQPKEIISGLVPVFKKLILEGYPDYKYEDQEIEDFMIEKIKDILSTKEEPPISAREPEGTIPGMPSQIRKMKIGDNNFDIRFSNDILVNTAEWLIRQGKLRKSDCPVVIGPKRNLVNAEPKHRYGEPFRAPRKLSNGLYIELNYSAADCINKARVLLERFGYTKQLLELA